MAQSPLIAHVNLARGFRGGERQTELLLRGLAACGWRQRLVARRGEPLAARLAGLAGLEVTAVAGHVAGAAFALRAAELVHVHEARALQAAWLARRFGGAPYVITRRVQQGPRHHRLNRAMYRGAARIAVLSAAIGASVRSLAPDLSVEIIPSAHADFAVDAARVAEIRRQIGAAFVVGHVGALVDSHKGQRRIIAVARELAARAPDIAFVLVGSGRDEAALRTEAADLPSVRFAGQVADVGDWLAACDAFLYPSRHEGLGSTLLDAMAVGLPVIATRVGGIPEIVRPGENGFLLEEGDVAGLAAAVLELASDADLRRRIAVANRRRAQEFSAEAMTGRYVSLYRDILPAAMGAARPT
jgi:glycosyltransferase involved in cell wall biosynthesis